jgi:DNA-binding GntR family transcriptional regulator
VVTPSAVVAQHLHTPYKTVRQAVNRLEEAGYVTYDDGLSAVDERVRDESFDGMQAAGGDTESGHTQGTSEI